MQTESTPNGAPTITAAFLGLGVMGYPMAGHLAKAFPTQVWNRTGEVAARHAAEYGTTPALDLRAAARADAIVSCVPTSAVVDDLVDRCWDALRPGTLWIDCTSGHPEESRRTAERLAERGVTFLDAPVSGSVPRATSGELTIMVGGDADALERARPFLETFGATIIHVGPTGAGHAVKAINNVMMAVSLWSASEGLLALERYGVPLSTALDVINASSGRSQATEGILPRPLTTGEYPDYFRLALLHKDARIAADLCRRMDCPAPLTALATELLGLARAGLRDNADYTEIARAVRQMNGDG